LTRCDLFAEVSAGAVKQLAEAATEVQVEAGKSVVREGEPADAYHVIASGALGVGSRGERPEPVVLGEMRDGEFFGEIGLIEHIPRTATVTATRPSRLLRIDGAAFLEALTESAPSPALLDGASLRLRRTHPSQPLTRSGLSGAEGTR